MRFAQWKLQNFFIVLFIFIFSPQVDAQTSFPTTEEFMNALGACATTQNIQIDANIRGGIETIYRGSRTEGYARILNQNKFLEFFPEKDRLTAYRVYTSCISRIISGNQSKLGDKCETAGLDQCRADYRSNPSSAILSCQKFLECDPTNRTALSILGNSYRNLGRISEAETIYEQLLDLAERSGDQALLAQALHQLAGVHSSKGALERAQFFVKRSLEINVRMGSLVGQGANHRIMADLDIRLGRLSEAERNFTQAINFLRGTADKLSLAQAYMGLGYVYSSSGRRADACANLRSARDIFENENFPRGITDVDRYMQRARC